MRNADGGGHFPPGLTAHAGGGEMRVDHEKLYAIYRRLQADMDQFHQGGQGTVAWFQNGAQGRVSLEDLGHYPAAEAVKQTCANAEQHIGNAYALFLAEYQHLLDALKRSAETHREAEEANTKSVTNVQRTVDDVEAWR